MPGQSLELLAESKFQEQAKTQPGAAPCQARSPESDPLFLRPPYVNRNGLRLFSPSPCFPHSLSCIFTFVQAVGLHIPLVVLEGYSHSFSKLAAPSACDHQYQPPKTYFTAPTNSPITSTNNLDFLRSAISLTLVLSVLESSSSQH